MDHVRINPVALEMTRKFDTSCFRIDREALKPKRRWDVASELPDRSGTDIFAHQKIVTLSEALFPRRTLLSDLVPRQQSLPTPNSLMVFLGFCGRL